MRLKARYTLVLGNLIEKNLLWNFNYDFFEEELKPIFQEYFNDRYFFKEIGFDSIEEFQFRLRATLNLKNVYYKQLWNVELESQKHDFMNSKNLVETFSRELDGTNNTTTNATSTGTNSSNNKVSTLDNGNASLSMDSLTGISEDVASGTNTSESSGVGSNKVIENTTFTSIGDIGIQTPAYAVREWRSVLINIFELIIDDCKDLFIQVY